MPTTTSLPYKLYCELVVIKINYIEGVRVDFSTKRADYNSVVQATFNRCLRNSTKRCVLEFIQKIHIYSVLVVSASFFTSFSRSLDSSTHQASENCEDHFRFNIDYMLGSGINTCTNFATHGQSVSKLFCYISINKISIGLLDGKYPLQKILA